MYYRLLITPKVKVKETSPGRDAPFFAAGDRCLSESPKANLHARRRQRALSRESCTAHQGLGEVPKATASRSRSVSRVTRCHRSPGARITEREPRSEAGGRRRLAKGGGERLRALCPCAGIPRASGKLHSPALALAVNCCLNSSIPRDSFSAFQVGRWRA